MSTSTKLLSIFSPLFAAPHKNAGFTLPGKTDNALPALKVNFAWCEDLKIGDTVVDMHDSVSSVSVRGDAWPANMLYRSKIQLKPWFSSISLPQQAAKQ